MFLLNRIFDENEEEILRGIYLFLKFVPEEVYCNLDANKMFDFGQLLEGLCFEREGLARQIWRNEKSNLLRIGHRL